MDPIEKLLQARELMLEVENYYIEEKGFCPYEIGFALRKLDEAIEEVAKKLESEKG